MAWDGRALSFRETLPPRSDPAGHQGLRCMRPPWLADDLRRGCSIAFAPDTGSAVVLLIGPRPVATFFEDPSSRIASSICSIDSLTRLDDAAKLAGMPRRKSVVKLPLMTEDELVRRQDCGSGIVSALRFAP